MLVTPIKTHKITEKDKDILKILDKYVLSLKENSAVVVTSKIVSICEGRIVSILAADKDKLIRNEAQYFLPREKNKYRVSLTITNNILAPSAGIDESNGNGYYVLWPKNPQKSANDIRKHLKTKFNLKNIGVILTDSKTTPLRWGITGIGISHSGFYAINSYIGKNDIFQRKFEYETVSVLDSLAASAVFTMGEGKEQTPIAVITDIPHIHFSKKDPSAKELAKLHIDLKDDLYGIFLENAPWKKGKKR